MIKFVNPKTKGITALWLIIAVLTVAVGGYFYYQKNLDPHENLPLPKPQVQDFEKNTEKTIPQASQINTSAWKTYRNEEYGFEVRYSAEFTAFTNKDGVNLINNEAAKEIETMHLEALADISFKALPKSQADYIKSQYLKYDHSNIKIADKIGTLYNINDPDGNKISIFVDFNNEIMLMSLNKDFYRKSFDQILATFRFLE